MQSLSLGKAKQLLIVFLLFANTALYADFGEKKIHLTGEATINGLPLANQIITCKQGSVFKSFTTDSIGHFDFAIHYVTPCLSGGGRKDIETLIKQVRDYNGTDLQFWVQDRTLLYTTDQIWETDYREYRKSASQDTVYTMKIDFTQESNDISAFTKHAKDLLEKAETIFKITSRQQIYEENKEAFPDYRFLYESFEWKGVPLHFYYTWTGIDKSWTGIQQQDARITISFKNYYGKIVRFVLSIDEYDIIRETAIEWN